DHLPFISFFFSSRRRHTRFSRDWSSDVCSSDLGDETFLAQLDKEVLDFDILVATPQYMPKLGKYARLLGPRGLMPNPKSGTVARSEERRVGKESSARWPA